MDSLLSHVRNLLSGDERLRSQQGQLLTNTVHELANKYDDRLIRMLYGDPVARDQFFIKISDSTEIEVFNKDKFVSFVNNKQFLPDSYTSFKNKIGLAVKERFLDESGDVVLSWPYKDCILEGGQDSEQAQRHELFWNTTLSSREIDRLLEPKALRGFKHFSANPRPPVGPVRASDNLVIKGNNLLALASLRKIFSGGIDLIYIDPPYNTGGDKDAFSYNNSFKHSTWYTFMKNRLELARDLLATKGFIAIAIDHFELLYLGVLADEIFGRHNRIGIVSVVHKPEGRNQEKFFATSNEFMLVYAKDKLQASFNNVVLSDSKKAEYSLKDGRGSYKLMNYLRAGGGDANLRKNKPHFWYPVFVSPDLAMVSTDTFSGAEEVYPRTKAGIDRTWKTRSETLQEMINENRIVAQRDPEGSISISEKYYSDERGQLIKTHWIDPRYNAINHGTNVVDGLIGSNEFSYPKSVFLIQDIVNIMCPADGIVLDFFAGSGTTGQAVLDLNVADGGTRRFVLCEQMDYIETVTIKRLEAVIKKNNSGSFVYLELAEWNHLLHRQIHEAGDKEALQMIWDKVKESEFLSARINVNAVNSSHEQFEQLTFDEMRHFLVECVEMNHLYVNLADIDSADRGFSELEREWNHSFYADRGSDNNGRI